MHRRLDDDVIAVAADCPGLHRPIARRDSLGALGGLLTCARPTRKRAPAPGRAGTNPEGSRQALFRPIRPGRRDRRGRFVGAPRSQQPVRGDDTPGARNARRPSAGTPLPIARRHGGRSPTSTVAAVLPLVKVPVLLVRGREPRPAADLLQKRSAGPGTSVAGTHPARSNRSGQRDIERFLAITYEHGQMLRRSLNPRDVRRPLPRITPLSS